MSVISYFAFYLVNYACLYVYALLNLKDIGGGQRGLFFGAGMSKNY